MLRYFPDTVIPIRMAVPCSFEPPSSRCPTSPPKVSTLCTPLVPFGISQKNRPDIQPPPTSASKRVEPFGPRGLRRWGLPCLGHPAQRHLGVHFGVPFGAPIAGGMRMAPELLRRRIPLLCWLKGNLEEFHPFWGVSSLCRSCMKARSWS